MKSQFTEWLNDFVTGYASETAIVSTAMDVTAEEEKAADDREVAHVTEEEQESRMKSVDEGYDVNTDNPDDKHFEQGATVSEKAFEQENKRDMTTPEGRYSRSFSSAELKALGEQIASEIVAEITNSALNPAEEMLNTEVPLAQLANLTAGVEQDLREEGIRRALFVQTRTRLAETLQVTLPIEVTVGQPSVADDSEAAPADDMGLGMLDEAPADDMAAPFGEEAPADEEKETESAMDDMMPMDAMASRKNRFAKK